MYFIIISLHMHGQKTEQNLIVLIVGLSYIPVQELLRLEVSFGGALETEPRFSAREGCALTHYVVFPAP